MPSILLVIFLTELAVQLVNSLGAETINGLIWRLVLALPTNLSRSHAEQREQQKTYLAVRYELNGISSQDEFAKWAKLRRKHDKLLDELEKKKTALDVSRAKFESALTTARVVSTRGLQWVLPFWYSKQPMFWLPHGWFPYYVEWFASFPRAPMGSVSIVVWQWACTSILALAIEFVIGLTALMRSETEMKTARDVREHGGRSTEERT